MNSISFIQAAFHRFSRTAISNVRLACIPLWNTRQDIALKEAILRSRESQKACLVHAFRGCRKSTSAMRLYLRRWFLPIHYVTADKINQKMTSDSILQPPMIHEIFQLSFTYFVLAILLGVVVLIKLMNNAERSIRKFLSDYMNRLKAELPTLAGVLVTILPLALQAARRRFRPIIIDDPIECYLSLLPKHRPLTATGFLDRLRRLGGQQPVVIISSNEGIASCFSDYAPGLHVTCPFPPLIPMELSRVAAEVAKQFTNSKLFILTQEHITKAEAVLPIHHALSIRFWMLLDEVDALEAFCTSLIDQKPYISTEVLCTLAFRIDLEAEEVFRATALAQSPLMTVDEKRKLIVLVGGKDELKWAQEFKDSNVPRRLGLTLALLRSKKQEFEEVMGSKKLVETVKKTAEKVKQLDIELARTQDPLNQMDQDSKKQKVYTLEVEKKELEQKIWEIQWQQKHSDETSKSTEHPNMDYYAVFLRRLAKALRFFDGGNARTAFDFDEYIKPIHKEVERLLAINIC